MRDPKDPAINVLYSKEAMAILEDACSRLKALGLQCAFGPDALFPESEMSAVLRVSTSSAAIDETIVGSLVVATFIATPSGRQYFDEQLAQFRARCAPEEGKITSGDVA